MWKWNLVELELPRYLDLEWQDICREHRGDQPILMVSRIEEIGWTSIRCIAPEEHIFGNVWLYPQFLAEHEEWLQARCLEDETYWKFRSLMKNYGVDVQSPIVHMLGAYASVGVYGRHGELPEIGKEPIQDSHRIGRLLVFECPTAAEGEVLKYFRNQVSQFGNTAFDQCSEDVILERVGGIDEDLLEELTFCLEWVPGMNVGDKSQDYCLEQAHNLLDLVLDSPDSWNQFVDKFGIKAAWLYKPEFQYVSAGPSGRWATISEPDVWCLYSKRARLVRELNRARWYGWACDRLEQINIEAEDFVELRDKASDIEEAFRNFVKHTETKYPVVLDSFLVKH